VPSSPDKIDPLVEAALAAQVPLDVTSQPGLWGGKMRGTQTVLTCISDSRYEHATEESHAADLIQAHLIETLSCIGREYFDIYFLRVRGPVEESKLSGVLQALEMARQEGHIRHIGLYSDGHPLPTLGLWQFHDAFEVLLTPDGESLEVLGGMAKERRVGVVALGTQPVEGRTVMVPVDSAEAIREVLP
jgi:hypothetical protein